MNKPQLSHKGFSGSSETSFEDNCLFGKILYIDDAIIYEGNTPLELKKSFVAAVDRYLEYCKKTGKPANRPYSGSFNVRTGCELHRQAVISADKFEMTLNELVCSAIRNFVITEGVCKVEHTHNNYIVYQTSVHDKQFTAVTSNPIGVISYEH